MEHIKLFSCTENGPHADDTTDRAVRAAERDAIRAALLNLVPQGRVTLVCIDPLHGNIACRTFPMPTSTGEATDWVAEKNALGRNVYWQVNDAPLLHARVKANEVESARYVWADIDPKVSDFDSYTAARNDLMTRVLPQLREVASIIVDSGNGLQALFRLDEEAPLQNAAVREEYLRINRLIGERFEGPGTHNADRILRLPGTLNYPTAAKLQKGYPAAPRLSCILVSSDRVYDPDGLRRLLGDESVSSTAASTAAPSAVGPDLQQRFEDLLVRNSAAHGRYTGGTEGLTDKSGSARDMSMVAMMKAFGFTKEEIRALLEGWQYGSVNGRRQGDRYWDRMYERGDARASPEAILAPTKPILPGLQNRATPFAVQAFRPRYKLSTASQIKALPPVSWRVKRLLPQRGLISIFGASNCGKTFVGIDLAAHIALGKDWFGYETKAGPVVYVALEGSTGIKQRIGAWENHHGLQLPPSFRVEFEHLSLFDDSDIGTFADAVKGAGVHDGLIVIDTLNQSAPGADENTSKDMGRIISNANELQKLTNSLVALVHHAGKDQSKGLRGHSSLLAALDVAIEVRRENGNRLWTVTKSKDSATGITGGFTLKPIVVGQDSDGADITSCAVEPDQTHLFRSKIRQPRGPNQIIAMREITALLTQVPCPPAQATKRIPLTIAIDAVAKSLTCDDKHRKDRALSAINGLVANDFLIHQGGQLWLA